MQPKISARIATYVRELPVKPWFRVLEIGCGPGAAAREISQRLQGGKIVGIDRSDKAISLALAGSGPELASGRLEFRITAVEEFELACGEAPFDLAFAMRVGALDGRHPAAGIRALQRLKVALKPEGLLFIDDRDPIRGGDL